MRITQVWRFFRIPTHFPLYSLVNVCEGITSLNCSKSNPTVAILAKVIKLNYEIFAKKLHLDFNRANDKCIFPP